jgi:hypothetical protein
LIAVHSVCVAVRRTIITVFGSGEAIRPITLGTVSWFSRIVIDAYSGSAMLLPGDRLGIRKTGYP